MTIHSQSPFLVGINYWPPRKAMYWWKDFDAGEVDEEFAQIAEYGFQVVRFFLLWEDFQPQPDTVNWDQLQNVGTVLEMAEKHHLKAMPTLLNGNMSGIMWFPPWAFSDQPQQGDTLQISEGRYIRKKLRSLFEDPVMLQAEVLLLESTVEMMGGHPALHSWDLANEIDQADQASSPQAGKEWARRLSDAIRGLSEADQVTYGAHSLSLTTRGLTIPAVARSLDYLSMHAYPMYSDVATGPLDSEVVPFMTALTEQLGGKPTMMQEFGICTSPSGEKSETIEDNFLGQRRPQFLASEEQGARYYASVLDRLWGIGGMGAMAWNYADYDQELWEKPPFDHAIRERTFGVFRADHSPKAAALVLKHFSNEVETGQIEHRLGKLGSRPIHFDLDPDTYYRDPAHCFQEAYRQFLQGAGSASPVQTSRTT